METPTSVTHNRSSMSQNETFIKNAHEFEKSIHGFIAAEVNTSLTFAEIALTTTDEMQRQEDRTNARKGYETALRFIAEAQEKFPDHPIAASSLEGMKKLKRMLDQLEERS